MFLKMMTCTVAQPGLRDRALHKRMYAVCLTQGNFPPPCITWNEGEACVSSHHECGRGEERLLSIWVVCARGISPFAEYSSTRALGIPYLKHQMPNVQDDTSTM